MATLWPPLLATPSSSPLGHSLFGHSSLAVSQLPFVGPLPLTIPPQLRTPNLSQALDPCGWDTSLPLYLLLTPANRWLGVVPNWILRLGLSPWGKERPQSVPGSGLGQAQRLGLTLVSGLTCLNERFSDELQAGWESIAVSG